MAARHALGHIREEVFVQSGWTESLIALKEGGDNQKPLNGMMGSADAHDTHRCFDEPVQTLAHVISDRESTCCSRIENTSLSFHFQ